MTVMYNSVHIALHQGSFLYRRLKSILKWIMWYDMIWYDMIYDMIGYDMIYDIVVWYDMIWDDIVWSCIISYHNISYNMGTSCLGFEMSWVRVVLGTSCLGYEMSWVRVVLSTSCLGYELSWVRVVLGTSCPDPLKNGYILIILLVLSICLLRMYVLNALWNVQNLFGFYIVIEQWIDIND